MPYALSAGGSVALECAGFAVDLPQLASFRFTPHGRAARHRAPAGSAIRPKERL